ncbi:MAG: MiaB/RimO family radical SAM methylthiotransferase, partial [Candidatus Omnitrophota bacterium]
SGFRVTGSPGITTFEGHERAFVKVQDGCDNTCSYCKVRIVRGPSRSRPYKEIIRECERLVKNNFKEIVLTGICLGAYGRDLSEKKDLTALIKELCGIEGEWRLRLSSIEPRDVTPSLIEMFRSLDRLCKHLPMPFQSGDDGVLKRMRRPYKAGDYLSIISDVRKEIPDVAISTDMMVGFPGETEKAFRNTVDFLKEARPMRAHVFPFSSRKGTAAHGYEDDVPLAVKKKREEALSALTKKLALEFARGFIGREAEVLIEGVRGGDGLLSGYTDRYIKVRVDAPDAFKSRIVNCRLTLTNREVCGILLSS